MDASNMHEKMQGHNPEKEGISFLSQPLRIRPHYFVDRRCTATWKLAHERIPWHDLTWVLEGRAVYRIDGLAHEAEAGDFLYLPEGSLREAWTDPCAPMRCLALNFDAVSWGGEPIVLPFPSRFRLPSALAREKVMALYRRLEHAWMEPAGTGRFEAQALLMELLVLLIKLRGQSDMPRETVERLERIRNTILQRYAEPLTVQGLAGEEGLHPVYFGQMFKANMGLSVREHLNRVRVHKAEEMLATGGYTVAEVAERCGFADPFHFSRVFRRYLGKCPSDIARA